MISYDELRDLALEQADTSPVAVRVVCTGKAHHLAVVKATPAGWLYQANTLFPPGQAALAREWLEDAKGGRHIDDALDARLVPRARRCRNPPA